MELPDAGIGKLLAGIEIESTKWKLETDRALKLVPYVADGIRIRGKKRSKFSFCPPVI